MLLPDRKKKYDTKVSKFKMFLAKLSIRAGDLSLRLVTLVNKQNSRQNYFPLLLKSGQLVTTL